MPASPQIGMIPTCSVVRRGNVGAGVENLLNLWIPGGTLKEIGDSIFVQGAVVLAVNINAKTGNIQIAGTTVSGRSSTDSGALYDMRARAYRTTTGLWVAGLCNNSATATQIGTNTDIANIDFTAPIEIRVQGQGVAADDVVSRVLKWVYIPVGVAL